MMPGIGHETQPDALAAAFLAELAARGRGASSSESLAEPLASLWQRVNSAWPALRLPADAYMAQLAAQLPDGDPGVALHEIHAEDLYLALGCALGYQSALEAFERSFDGDLSLALAKYPNHATARDDLAQVVYQKLFVDQPGSRARIWNYSGRGPLRAWFRVAAVRSLLDLERRERGEPKPLDDEQLMVVPSEARDPELEYLRRLYSHEFKLAFERAAREISPQERTVLRAYYAERLTVDQIAGMLGLHRANAARRVQKARERLLSDTRRRLAEKLSLSRRDLESIMRLIESQLHVSVQRVL